MHIAALQKLEKDADKAAPARHAEAEKLRAIAVASAKQAKEDAACYNDCMARSAAASGTYQHLRALHEGALVDSADPAIGAFLADMLDEIAATRRMFGYTVTLSDPNLAGRRVEKTTNNGATVNARITAIRDAMAEAEALRLKADQAGVTARLKFLRDSLPKVEQAVFEPTDAESNR